MAKLIVNGGKRLNGCVNLQGSKNSALPILAASAAVNGVSVIHNCPELTDVSAAMNILSHIGCKVRREGGTVVVDSTGASKSEIPESLMHEMRSSIIFLGALLSRFGECTVTAPGGCEIGLRPIDLHLSALRAMGAVITESGGVLRCRAEKLSGCCINLGFPSVGATENIMLASLGAHGETVIHNAAREPEIEDLACFLQKCGANIRGAGQSVVSVSASRKLTAAEHKVIPDRIVASTYIAGTACAGGTVTVRDAEYSHLLPVIPAFEAMGCGICAKNNELRIVCEKRPTRVKLIRTMPYPGFPTDSQAIIMAVAAKAKGTSIITEKIFENRFRHVPELVKMGADIRVEDGCVAIVEGVENLHGARVESTDLRGGSALAVAAMGARGQTVIEKIHHIDRGCEAFEKRFAELGADIKRAD